MPRFLPESARSGEDQFRTLTCYEKTIDKVLVLLQKNGLVENWELRRFQRDSWGNEYHWESIVSESSYTIKITSSGRNGKFESGKGDDITLMIELPADPAAKPVIMLEP